MLTKDIKKIIDDARDVLVGKIPNPQAQIEQITTAMIYKFMDDMDIESIALGGERQFFTDELEPYVWSKLISPQLGAQAKMNLYTEALEKLPLAQNIPTLFRDIFKGAYLPFRDAQTLSLFLKEINKLTYNNSENLGNGFEYLLSIMGSQGDAGQFRTPRHIIDFIVDVVKPSKTDTILDPACGTAGFLISAYKYILKTAEKENKQLTPKERINLTENIEGYDISPDMKKLALVNLYLHKFKDPQIVEYDTLTNESRWESYFDVILANPPFMTPKGGIKPHNKFSIKANRSEVLFVDYIMEHINSKGKAGVIVPEGIVFQSANAYKELRKKLVDEKFLYAVVSLPSGVFQPYSGVKTSILFMDKQLAKKTDKVLFVEIKNDGFDLGAQRREIDKNDIPKALELIDEWQNAINTQADFQPKSELAILVEKSKIAENEEYNLTASRYKEQKDYTNCKWEMVKLDDVFIEIKNGKNVEQFDEIGKYRVSRIQTIANGVIDLEKTKWTNDEVSEGDFLQKGDILLSHINSFEHLAKTAIFNDATKVVHGVNLIRFRANQEKIKPEYAIYIFKSQNFINIAKSFAQKAVNQASIKVADLKTIEIPLPPLEVQEEIVKELDSYQAVIDGAQKVVDNWKPTLTINPNWEKAKLGDICTTTSGGTPLKSKQEYYFPEEIPWVCSGEVRNGEIFSSDKFISSLGLKESSAKIIPSDSVLVAMYGATAGQVGLLKFEAATNQAICSILPNKKINSKYLYYILKSKTKSLLNMSVGGAQPNISQAIIKTIQIPFPPLNTQEEIVAKIEEEEKAVEECKKLIEIHKAKINAKIQSVWGDDCE